MKLFLHLHRQGQNLHFTNQGGDTFLATKNLSSNLLLSGGLQLRNHDWFFIMIVLTKESNRNVFDKDSEKNWKMVRGMPGALPGGTNTISNASTLSG